MKTKFKQSNISISGEIGIHVLTPGMLFVSTKLIELTGSKGKTKSGIYCLRNKLHPERYYIGMARNLETRLQHHFSDLSLYKHKNKLMQKDLQTACDLECGEVEPNRLFEMEVILYCRPSELTFYENILINNLHPYYNIHKQESAEPTDEEVNEYLTNKINNNLNSEELDQFNQKMIEEQADRFNGE